MSRNIRDLMTIVEANRIGTAIRLNEIPRQYKGLKVIGRGATSVVLEKDPKTVLMFTRDVMKMEWLRHMEIGRIIDEYESHAHHIRGMNELPIYVFEMPRFEKLDKANTKLVRAALKEFETVLWSKSNIPKQRRYQEVLMHFSENENHILADLWNHLMNYDAGQFSFDLGARNFMQDANGRIVILDPIVVTELLDLFRCGSQPGAGRGW